MGSDLSASYEVSAEISITLILKNHCGNDNYSLVKLVFILGAHADSQLHAR